MPMPGILKYISAVSNPHLCFTDEDLRSAHAIGSRIGNTVYPASGRFACVFQMANNSSTWAVRCFINREPDEMRYAAVSRHLKQCHLSWMATFEFLSDGIRVGDSKYPILKMEWVNGTPLTSYVDKWRHTADEARCPDEPRRLAGEWCKMLADLRSCSIAHGDLQHGNVLVTDEGRIKLVDYDGMYVPELHGMPSTEEGVPDYQHPNRRLDDSKLHPNMDVFSGHVVNLALCAMAHDKTLWDEFGDEEHLLFADKDYLDPAHSKLFNRLCTCSDRTVASHAKSLYEACLQGPAVLPQVPVPLLRRCPSLTRSRSENKWWQKYEDRRLKDSLPPPPKSMTWRQLEEDGARKGSLGTVGEAAPPGKVFWSVAYYMLTSAAFLVLLQWLMPHVLSMDGRQFVSEHALGALSFAALLTCLALYEYRELREFDDGLVPETKAETAQYRDRRRAMLPWSVAGTLLLLWVVVVGISLGSGKVAARLLPVGDSAVVGVISTTLAAVAAFVLFISGWIRNRKSSAERKVRAVVWLLLIGLLCCLFGRGRDIMQQVSASEWIVVLPLIPLTVAACVALFVLREPKGHCSDYEVANEVRPATVIVIGGLAAMALFVPGIIVGSWLSWFSLEDAVYESGLMAAGGLVYGATMARAVLRL